MDFAKSTALHARTLSPLVWDPQFAKVRVAGCKRHTCSIGIYTEYVVHIKPSRVEIQQIGLCYKNTVSAGMRVEACYRCNTACWICYGRLHCLCDGVLSAKCRTVNTPHINSNWCVHSRCRADQMKSRKVSCNAPPRKRICPTPTSSPLSRLTNSNFHPDLALMRI